jgi:hypothetical protein
MRGIQGIPLLRIVRCLHEPVPGAVPPDVWNVQSGVGLEFAAGPESFGPGAGAQYSDAPDLEAYRGCTNSTWGSNFKLCSGVLPFTVCTLMSQHVVCPRLNVWFVHDRLRQSPISWQV